MLLKGRSSPAWGDLGVGLCPSSLSPCNKPTQAQWYKITVILLYSRILSVRNLNRACQGQFVSTPQHMSPNLVGLAWLGVTRMSGGWNHPEASSLTCLMSGLRWPAGWAQLELSTRVSPCDMGFLPEWQLRVVGFLTWQPEAPRESVLANKVKSTWPHLPCSIDQSSHKRVQLQGRHSSYDKRYVNELVALFKNHCVSKNHVFPVGF